MLLNDDLANLYLKAMRSTGAKKIDNSALDVTDAKSTFIDW